MRKLASVREVKDLVPIEGADAIELALVDGWQCIVKKNEFRKGGLGIYFEIDAFLPLEGRFEFLRKSSYKKLPDGTEGFRLKTIKLRGQLSQGLILPLAKFPELEAPVVGDDVTNLLGIRKYEPPQAMDPASQIKGPFPDFIRKSEQERIQNLWDDYSVRFKSHAFEVSTKLDGMSCTVFTTSDHAGVCSRNYELHDNTSSIYWKLVHELELLEALHAAQASVALQMEVVGPGIQGNHDKFEKLDAYVYDVWECNQNRYLTSSERQAFLDKLNREGRLSRPLKHVPILDMIPVFQRFDSLESLLAYSEGPSVNPNRPREGIVCKSTEPVDGDIVSFKVLSNPYLLKHG